MTTLALKRSINIALNDWNHDDSKASFHYAFAIKNNKIIAWGKNNETSGSKFALKNGKTILIYMLNVMFCQSLIFLK